MCYHRTCAPPPSGPRQPLAPPHLSSGVLLRDPHLLCHLAHRVRNLSGLAGGVGSRVGLHRSPPCCRLLSCALSSRCRHSSWRQYSMEGACVTMQARAWALGHCRHDLRDFRGSGLTHPHRFPRFTPPASGPTCQLDVGRLLCRRLDLKLPLSRHAQLCRLLRCRLVCLSHLLGLCLCCRGCLQLPLSGSQLICRGSDKQGGGLMEYHLPFGKVIPLRARGLLRMSTLLESLPPCNS